MSQSPLHSTLMGCAMVVDRMARGANGMIAITMYIAISIPAIM